MKALLTLFTLGSLLTTGQADAAGQAPCPPALDFELRRLNSN